MEYSETRSFHIGSGSPSTFSYSWDISVDKSLNDVSSLVVEISTKAIFDHVSRESANPSSQSLTPKDVNNLPDYEICFEKKGCLICCEHFRYKEVVKSLPCSHLFHTVCIMKWLCKVATCPHCRGTVKPTVFRLPGNFLKIVAKQKLPNSETEEILEVYPDISAEVELVPCGTSQASNVIDDPSLEVEVGTIQHILIDSDSHREEIRLITEDQSISERFELDSLSDMKRNSRRRQKHLYSKCSSYQKGLNSVTNPAYRTGFPFLRCHPIFDRRLMHSRLSSFQRKQDIVFSGRQRMLL